MESLKAVRVDETEICLAHAEDGNFYAINDVCTHENFLLSMGEAHRRASRLDLLQ